MARKATPDELLRPTSPAGEDELVLVFGGAGQAAGGLQGVDVELIDDNPYQPRVDYTGIEELAADIEANGLLQAPRGRRMPDGRVQLQYGHRRLRAVRHLGWRTMQIDVQTEISDEEMAARAWSENHNRQDFTAMDQARYFRKLVDAGWTQKAIAQRLRLSEPTVSNTLRLLKLPEEVQVLVTKGEISQRKAEALVPMYTWPAEMREAANTCPREWLRPAKQIANAKNDGWTSDSVRERVKELQQAVTYQVPASWANVPFRDGQFKAPVCAQCAHTHDGRCYIQQCWQAKSDAWREIENAKVVKEAGVAMAPERLDYHEKTDLGAEELALLENAGKLPGMANACPNLRVDKEAYSHRRLTGKDYGLCCVHPGKSQCSCVVSAKGQRTRSSKVVWGPIRQQTVDSLTAALDVIPTPILRLVASLQRSVYNKEPLPTGREELTTILVDALLKWHLPQEPEKDAVRSKKAIETMLAIAGLTAPWVETSATIGKRLDEIQAWLDQYMNPEDGVPTAEAMGKTLADLEKLADAAGQLGEDEAKKLRERQGRLWVEAIALNERVGKAAEARQ